MQMGRIDPNGTAQRLFDKTPFSEAGYPRLQAVFERMVAASLENLREVCPVPPQYVFKKAQAESLAETLSAVRDKGILGIFSVPEWEERVYFLVDRAFLFAITESLFGGDGDGPAFEADRKFSQIEKNVARAAILAAAKALQSSLAPVLDLTFNLERIETDMDAVSDEDRLSQAVVARFELRAMGRSGELSVIIPQAAIRSARAAKGEPEEGREERKQAEAETARRFDDEVKQTEVKLTAVLEQRPMALSELSSLKVGQVIPLNARLGGYIRLVCDNEPLLLCAVGQAGGSYALRVEQVFEGRERMKA